RVCGNPGGGPPPPARLGDREDPPAPPGAAEREREDGERGRDEEDGEGELPLPAAGRRDGGGMHAVGLSHAEGRRPAPPAGGSHATAPAAGRVAVRGAGLGA